MNVTVRAALGTTVARKLKVIDFERGYANQCVPCMEDARLWMRKHPAWFQRESHKNGISGLMDLGNEKWFQSPQA